MPLYQRRKDNNTILYFYIKQVGLDIFISRWQNEDSYKQNIFKKQPNALTSQKSYQKLITQKEKKGYVYVKEKITEPSFTYIPLPSNKALETLIHQNNTIKNWLVYADWLQIQGDQRGELIILEYKLSKNKYNQEIKKSAQAIQSERYQWLGEKLGLYFLESQNFKNRYIHDQTAYFYIKWQYGFFQHIIINYNLKNYYIDIEEIFSQTLDSPPALFLQSLTITLDYSKKKYFQKLLQVTYNTIFPSLRYLKLYENTSYIDPSNLIEKMPQLEQLDLHGIVYSNKDLSSQSLKTIKLENILYIQNIITPNLQSLEITLHSDISQSMLEQLAYINVPKLEKIFIRFENISNFNFIKKLIKNKHIKIIMLYTNFASIDLLVNILEENLALKVLLINGILEDGDISTLMHYERKLLNISSVHLSHNFSEKGKQTISKRLFKHIL